LCGWAMLSAVECIRQISKAPVPIAQPANAQTYVTAMRPIDSSAPDTSPCPRETCNFSHGDRVLGLN
jgi:hypothetical protein